MKCQSLFMCVCGEGGGGRNLPILLFVEFAQRVVLQCLNGEHETNQINESYRLALNARHAGLKFQQTHFETIFIFFPENSIWHFLQIV